MGGFSAGARTCIGKHLALLENKIFMIKLLMKYSKVVMPEKIDKTYSEAYKVKPYKAKLIKT